MDKDYEQDYFKLEKEHWWFKGKRDLIKRIKVSSDAKILEVGCSSCINLKEFPTKEKYGIDISKEAVERAKAQGIKAVQGDVTKELPFEENTFDLILALDIIEHIDNDKELIKNLTKLLKKDGKLVINTSAFQFLWSHHDVLCQHKKRYTKKEIKGLTNGLLKTQILTYWDFTIFPGAFLIIKLNNFLKKEETTAKEENPIVNKILFNILKVENFLVENRISLPWGVSVYYIGKKISS